MTARRLRAAISACGCARGQLGAARVALALVVAGCGATPSGHKPDLSKLPMVPGSRVVVQVEQCDRGANAYCAVQLVVTNPLYRSSDALLASERRHLRRLGWAATDGDTSDEKGADSPSHKLRLTLATASGDLKGIDLGWIHRSRSITLALSREMFDRSAALSMMLEVGTS